MVCQAVHTKAKQYLGGSKKGFLTVHLLRIIVFFRNGSHRHEHSLHYRHVRTLWVRPVGKFLRSSNLRTIRLTVGSWVGPLRECYDFAVRNQP
jgi:hypothetical protein